MAYIGEDGAELPAVVCFCITTSTEHRIVAAQAMVRSHLLGFRVRHRLFQRMLRKHEDNLWRWLW